ncbi:unnamed protein product [Dracunculus medinensis]|uniref:Cyclic nucleotide-binding domain-containing protein n=1 Tax=Dracunculus medinensis TaxID=318479 RepID=A0A0N4U5A2_DRAME|nr:unnamed protein product [Dracunculus medinensis]
MNRRNLIKEMYIIKSGKVNKISEDGQIVLKMLNEGSVLGQLAIMNLTNNKHSTSIRSCGYVDVSVLKQDDVSELLCDYPEERQKLLKKASEILKNEGHQGTVEEVTGKWQWKTTEELLISISKDIKSIDEQITQLYDDFS